MLDRTVPAATYHRLRVLRGRKRSAPCFVRVGTMLFPAVVDGEAAVFIGGAVFRSRVESAWQPLRPGDRAGLDERVAFRWRHDSRSPLTLAARLQGEFHRAVRHLREKVGPACPASVYLLRR